MGVKVHEGREHVMARETEPPQHLLGIKGELRAAAHVGVVIFS